MFKYNLKVNSIYGFFFYLFLITFFISAPLIAEESAALSLELVIQGGLGCLDPFMKQIIA